MFIVGVVGILSIMMMYDIREDSRSVNNKFDMSEAVVFYNSPITLVVSNEDHGSDYSEDAADIRCNIPKHKKEIISKPFEKIYHFSDIDFDTNKVITIYNGTNPDGSPKAYIPKRNKDGFYNGSFDDGKLI